MTTTTEKENPTMPTKTVSRETANGTQLRPIDGGSGEAPPSTAVVMLAIDSIDVGENVRKDVAGVDELAASVLEHGVLQPIKVRPAGDGYAVVWGQRRLMAARKAALTWIPAIIDTDEQTPAELSTEQLVENLHRADLNPMDRARAMRAVVDSGVKQVDLAKMLGLAPSTVANDLRLLETHVVVQHSLEMGKLTPAHARAIATLDVDLQADFAKRVVSQAMSAHDAERNAKYVAEDAKRIRERKAVTEAHTAAAIAMLAKVANPKKATLSVVDYNGGDEVRKALAAAGWKVSADYNAQVVDIDCGCGAWRVEIPYNKGEVKLKPACISEEHRNVRQAAQNAKYEAQRTADQAKRDAQEQAAKARALRLADYLEAQLSMPTPGAEPSALTLRLAIYALLHESYGENVLDEVWNGTADAREALDDGTWEVLATVPDEKLGMILGRAIADEIAGWRGSSELVEAAIDAVLPPVASDATAEPGLTWYGLRRSPNGGYTPAHEFPSDIRISMPNPRPRNASCGFNPTNDNNGHFDMLVELTELAPKAVQKKCPRCLSIANGRAAAAFQEAIAESAPA